MKIKVIQEYKDTQLNRIVKTGEELEVTDERGKRLISAKVGIEIPMERTKKTAKKRKVVDDE